jgi:death-on-curing protein
MIKFSKEKVLLLHQIMAEATGGSVGVRDEGLLDSALNAPFQGFGDYEFYPTVTDKAVRLGYGLIENHPFHAGNKCIGACPRYANLA